MERQTIARGLGAVAGRPEMIAPALGGPGADWREELPELRGAVVTLREPRLSDAAALWSMLAASEVSRYMAAPPPSIEGFERFIAWTLAERAAGNHVCFVVVPRCTEGPIGIFQIRRLDATFETAEWGFALGSDFWGRGAYADAAAMVIEFAFASIGARRLVARAAVANARGNGALRKVGATREAVLCGGLEKDGQRLDQALWTISDLDWRRTHGRPLAMVTH